MQFQSHASGDVRFGPDGCLYASTGDGASFDTQDYGQGGNPCGDPANEGGSLRVPGLPDQRRPARARRRDLADQPGHRPGPERRRRQRRPDRDLRPAQPVAASPSGPAPSELWSGGRRRQRLGGDQPHRHGGVRRTRSTYGWPCYEGKAGRRGEAAVVGRARQADLREPLRRAAPSAVQAPVLLLPDPRRRPADPGRAAARARRRRSRASPSSRPRATTRRRTRARCSSPTTPARASGGWARRRTATRTRPSILPFVQNAVDARSTS